MELDQSTSDQTANIDKQKEAYFESMALYHIVGLSKWSKLTESRLVPERLIREVSKELLEDLFPGRDDETVVEKEAEAIEEDYYHENYASSQYNYHSNDKEYSTDVASDKKHQEVPTAP